MIYPGIKIIHCPHYPFHNMCSSIYISLGNQADIGKRTWDSRSQLSLQTQHTGMQDIKQNPCFLGAWDLVEEMNFINMKQRQSKVFDLRISVLVYAVQKFSRLLSKGLEVGQEQREINF